MIQKIRNNMSWLLIPLVGLALLSFILMDANFSPGGPNYTHFKQAAFDTLYEAALLRSALKERVDLYQQMDDMIMNYYPVVPLYYDQAVRFVQKDVDNT